ncbi:hypothetical protein L873DRAFT_1800238, partial [Choiromyces venosus 120613-1]
MDKELSGWCVQMDSGCSRDQIKEGRALNCFHSGEGDIAPCERDSLDVGRGEYTVDGIFDDQSPLSHGDAFLWYRGISQEEGFGCRGRL